MKIVVALDKFKGSLTAARACGIVRDTLLSVQPDLQIILKPMADGGDGTAEAFHTALGGEWISLPVRGPLSRTTGRYLWLANEKLVVIEMASASGLALLNPEQRDPLRTTTFGTGELIRDAVGRCVQNILLGVGGSATVDGGVGAAMALGWKFLDDEGMSAGLGGGALEVIEKIERPDELLLPAIEVLCDVDNPLCGERGAARVFGPQKGATPEMVEQLDAGLRHLAALVKTQIGKDIADVPGAGAAGGLAFGALAFMDARLVSGVDAVTDAIDLDSALRGADWVITGEGRFDEQSLRGKIVSGVAKRARRFGVNVAVLAGSVNIPKPDGIKVLLALQKKGMSLDHAMANGERLLAERARQLAAAL